ncbi:UbiA prenyltransferase family-domain-containing protein [Hypoxylon crocopeplum]|nr:UbiA prenyltransferase family-domain-containing protein [Hypoxylon crocopeplum]
MAYRAYQNILRAGCSSDFQNVRLRKFLLPLHSLCYHTYTLWLFIVNDVQNLTIVGILFGALNASAAPMFSGRPASSLIQIISAVPSMAIWSVSNLLMFNMHNQRRSKAEDSLNKPWRPIPAGRITERQTTLLICALWPIVFSVTAMLGGLGPCLLQAVVCLWYNEFGGSDNPFLKNLANGIGIPCFLAGPLEVALGRSIFADGDVLPTWILLLSGAIVVTNHTQDFRDVKGDRAHKRVTVPLAIGDTNARVAAALGVFTFTQLSSLFWDAGLKTSGTAWVAGIVLVGNLFLNKSQKGDDLSWKKLWFIWMLSLFFLPFLKYHL